MLLLVSRMDLLSAYGRRRRRISSREGKGHRSELAFMVPNEEQVHALRNDWKKFGVKIEQDLHEAAFGLTFVALDPNGHRIRVCMPDKDK